MTANKPVLGVTLYSFTNEWVVKAFTLEELLATVAQNKLGPAVEVVGFQSFRSYPDVPQDFATRFRDELDRNGLIPSCLGANMDFGRRPGMLMTDEEKIEYLQRQIDSAVRLGFPVLRLQTSVGTKILEKFVPLLERANLHMGFELHAPLSMDNPEVIEFRETFDRLQTPSLGFIPDFSTSMTSIPEGIWQELRELGLPETLISDAKDVWVHTDAIPDKFKGIAGLVQKYNVPSELIGKLNGTMTMFGHMLPENWREIMPYVRHIHGKFYHVNEEGIEPSIPYPRLMQVLLDVGYTGTISAEWEGHSYTREPLALGEVKAWRRMCNRLLGYE